MSPHPAGTPDLDPLFFPRRIGIAGLSNREQTWGRKTLRNLRGGGFDGDVVAVAPRSEVDVPSVTDLADLDAPLDLLLVALPAARVPDLIAQARRTGAARSALVFSAGFREAGPDGGAREDELVAAADGLPVVGPNCVGLLSRPGNAVPTVSAFVDRPDHPPAGPVAIVSQSGALGFVMAALLERHGVSVGYYASVGNEACLGIGDLGAYLIERPDVAVLGLYVESVRDVAALRHVADRAARLGKRVVALKAGLSAAGRRATLSHTAAVAGDALLFRSLCANTGIILAESDEAFADLLHAAQRPHALPRRPRIAIATMTGGGGAILADRLGVVGATAPQLGDHTRKLIADLDLASIASDANPIDLGGNFDRDADKLGRLFEILDDDPDVDGIAAMFTFGDARADWYRRLAADLAARRTPAWLVWAAGTAAARAGAPPGVVFDTIESLIRGLPAAFAPPPAARAVPEVPDAARTALRGARAGVLSEADAHRVVAALGCDYVPTVVADDPAGLRRAVAGLPTEPSTGPGYVLKVDSPQVAHRARLGLIRLGVPEADIETAAGELVDAARRQGVTDTRLVAQPLLDQRGELVVGAVRDPQYGPAIIVGTGGTRVEDTDAHRTALLLPAGPAAVADAAAEIAARHGDIDTAALTALLTAAGGLMAADPQVTELDINPLLIRPDGSLVAVDSLIVLADAP